MELHHCRKCPLFTQTSRLWPVRFIGCSVMRGKTMFLGRHVVRTADWQGRFCCSHPTSCGDRPCYQVRTRSPTRKECRSSFPPYPKPSADHLRGSRTSIYKSFLTCYPLSWPPPTLHRRHVLSVKQFSQRDTYDLFPLAHEMRLQVEHNGRGKAPL
ncbi:hypothetical protein PISMIDRAFT_402638 [Pisolithus microcarpus 441]|uniref:Uncharacterized protein n=1 Tax=Pisolithus microcarpus 441 TaxID=765257 RepID=A0A0C9YHR9_9AGAM|nr:hypothetical protein PISMIDRAFT_402638 [Pisolithus microcarpus 441]